MRRFIAYCYLTFFTISLAAQAPKKLNAAEIKQALNKLEVLGSVMYWAAHPDDENTRMIAYMANERNMRTAYLSMTRGDGGQNLIGTEIREYLGIIRTQELLAARRTDGGEQFFTRANDFGFSKNPDETFDIWDEDAVLADAVYNIRRFKPDIIITRFDTARVPGGRMHGHHTAASILAMKAYDIAADPDAYPEQLKTVDVWQPKGLYWNTYNFRGVNDNEFAGESGYYEVPVGDYNPLLGKSYDEISALSRSQHKSQGFGSTGRRGGLNEYLFYWKGEKPNSDVLETINTSWSRVDGGKAIGELIRQVNEAYDLQAPSKSIDGLLQARDLILDLSDEYWRSVKLKEIDLIIKSILGMYLEVVASSPTATQGEEVNLNIEAINRSDAKVVLNSFELIGTKASYNTAQLLENNQGFNTQLSFVVNKEVSQPYWLKEEATLGMYQVKEQTLRGLPENPAAYVGRFSMTINDQPYVYETPLVFKRNDRVIGEYYRPFVITPPIYVNIDETVLVFPDNEPKEINVTVIAARDGVAGEVNLNLPNGWQIYPEVQAFAIEQKGGEFRAVFQVLPPAGTSEGFAEATVTVDGSQYRAGLKQIDYPHIPYQTIFPESSAKVVKVDLKKRGQYVGYIMGSGDAIPESLEQIGYSVDLLDPNNVTVEMLESYDAVIIGIRAFNTIERMSVIQPELMKYVENGGTVIAQYNTSMRNQPDIGPYPFTISRDRVTKEEAEVTILAPEHPLINGPNKITSEDFDGWVQERGLYFPNEWDDRYVPILAANDPGEPSRKGGLLVAEYGKGYFVYTGYSWFRELPAGVPGAFRIFANMISLGNDIPEYHLEKEGNKQ
jgi:LmbE family N-acetylglucosaminyl deacetylase